jgi:2C-methyl-D-erythritol 2,4-cyclodiphosphate synthase
MRAALAPVLGVDVGDISIKGKSNEAMGSIGAGEGLACLAVVALASASTR